MCYHIFAVVNPAEVIKVCVPKSISYRVSSSLLFKKVTVFLHHSTRNFQRKFGFLFILSMLLIYSLQRAYIFRSERKNTNVLINDKEKEVIIKHGI